MYSYSNNVTEDLKYKLMVILIIKIIAYVVYLSRIGILGHEKTRKIAKNFSLCSILSFSCLKSLVKIQLKIKNLF